MNTIVIIPARGGSKGIRGKNLKQVCSLTLIARAVWNAKRATKVDSVYVTTDCDEIADQARVYGATVIKQPSEISQDNCLSELALEYALGQIQNPPSFFVFMQCTCPLTLPEDIDGAINHYMNVNADTLVTVSESITTPFVWQEDTTIKDGTALAIGHDPSRRLRRQEIKNLNYIENGAFYIIDTWMFLKTKSRFFGKITMYKMPTSRSLDIDTEQDLKIAKLLLMEQ